MAQNAIKEYEVVVIGGSAGSLEVILQIVSALKKTTRSAVIIVLHRKNDADSLLAELIGMRTWLPVKEVEDKDPILPGRIYIAPPNYHLLVEDRHSFSLDSSEKIFYSRPSIDVTFESVADVFGAAAMGVLLSGANADGAKGLNKIKRVGGFTIVQEPSSADVDFMPKQAINLFNPDVVVAGNTLPSFVTKLLTGT